MKVGVKANVFNWVMRERRAELGLTQKQLADEAGVSIAVVQAAESLKQMGGKSYRMGFGAYNA